MNNVIGIVNYGVAGNIHSIKKSIIKAGGDVLIIERPSDFAKVDKVVLPGVGTFKNAMQELEADGFIENIKDFSKPILGICLGMQVLSRLGFEYGMTEGLNRVNAEVKPIICNGKVPHVGYNTINVVSENELLKGLDKEKFYFMHSYEVVNYTNISALTIYSGHEFVSAIKKGNIYGVQFHPEKSREVGIELFANFIRL